MIGTDVFSVVFCTLILIYACYSDIKTRIVTNRLWGLMIAVGCLIAVYNCFRFGIPFLLGFTVSVFSTFCLTYLCFRLRLFGGADAKCLIAISVLIPVQPDFALVYSQLLLFPFAITTLFNAAIISLCVPLGLFVYNILTLSREELKGNLGSAFIGYKSRIEALSDKAAKHTSLVHWYEEEESDLKRVFVFGGVEIDTEVVQELKRYHAQGKIGDKVWVTPGLPYILFITAGFFTALIFGNLIFCIMFSILL